MNCVLLGAIVGSCVDYKNMKDKSNINKKYE